MSVQHFTFERIRSGAEPLAFRPDGAGGATLTLRSLGEDTLALGSVRAGILQPGDTVAVSRGGAAVFRGTVEERVWHGWRGAALEESFTVCGPWRRLARLPFTQLWRMMVEAVDPATGLPTFTLEQAASSLAVLNQRADGTALPVRDQVLEILTSAAAAGIIAEPAAADVAAIPAELTLPFDEGRDLTLAQALAREMRYTPHLATRFDYSVDPPRLTVVAPAAGDAAWISDAAADGAVQDIKETLSALPPLGCVLEIHETGSINGTAYMIRRAQEAGDTSNPERTLRAVLPTAGKESSRSVRKLDLKTADIPVDLNSVAFWRQWHQDLRTVPEAGLVISNAQRGGSDTAAYPRFVITAGVGLADLEEAGVTLFRVETLTCTATITSNTFINDENNVQQDIETVESAALTLEIIATNAETRLYRWTSSRDYTGPEYVPPGLAAALLASHQADGASAEVTVALRPDATLPRPGDTRADLSAHTVTVDLRTLIATAAFGPPAALGPADLAGFLTAFRNLRRATSHTRRDTGEADGGEAADATLEYLPSTSSGFTKTGTSKLEIGSGSGAKISMDPADLESGKPAQFRTIPTFSGMSRVLCDEPANTGYDEEDITLYCAQFKLTGKLISKTVESVKTIYGITTLSIVPYTSADKYKPLQGLEPSTGTYTLGTDYARMAD